MGTKERKTLGDVISEAFLQEWDGEKNELTPFDYSYGSLQKTWWKCSYCSHSWETSVRNRANGSGCPICSRIKTDITKTDMWAEKLQVEWCESNGNPRQFGTGNSAKLDWKCQKCCNVWQATLTYRFGEDAKCPYCAGLKAIAGVNDFGTLYPDLFEEWDYDKNKENPTEITVKSSRINYWRCQLGHEWQASVQYRVERSSTCPVCANKKVLAGFNDLATTDPEFLEEWDYESNGRKRVFPEKVIRNSDTKVSWKCTAKGHTWRTSIRHRTISGSNCPTCYSENQGILKDREKSFGAMLPDLLQEWNYEKNDVSPFEIPMSYAKKVWWKGDCGHEWQRTIKARRTYDAFPCPYCAGRETLAGFNDLATVRPDLVAEWSSRNTFAPDTVTQGSDKKVIWVCQKKHEWIASVGSRGFYNSRCPECASKQFSSKGERELATFVEELVGEENVITNTRRIIFPSELDIYIPGKKIAVEYNGLYWHSEEAGKNKNYHYDKWLRSQKQGVQLITVWEDDWRDKKDLVKAMLEYKLGVSQSKKIYARNTIVEETTYDKIVSFMNDSHIQGAVKGSKYITLKDKKTKDIIAVSIWLRKDDETVYLERYATSCSVVGGLGKIISYVQKEIYTTHDVITFADHAISNGDLYTKLGFINIQTLPPDYSYLVNGVRIHKFNYRKNRFEKDPNLEYREGLTEKELAKLNNMPRIWDSGKTKFILKRKQS